MLKDVLKKKLCPVISLALAFGCGKKISETPPSDLASSRSNQEPSEELVLKLIERESIKKTFTLPRNGIFKIPDKLFIERGLGLGRKVTITYNKEPGENIFEFKCTYRSRTEVDNLPLEKCVDMGNGDFGDVAGQTFPMLQDKQIELNLINPNNIDLEVHAWYDVEWK